MKIWVLTKKDILNVIHDVQSATGTEFPDEEILVYIESRSYMQKKQLKY